MLLHKRWNAFDREKKYLKAKMSNITKTFTSLFTFSFCSKKFTTLAQHYPLTCHSQKLLSLSFSHDQWSIIPSSEKQITEKRWWPDLRWWKPGSQVASIPREAFCPTACFSGNSCHHPLRCSMTTSSLPLLCFLLFNYPQLSLVLFVFSRRRSKKKKFNRLLPRCMQIFAQTPLSRWEMW